jgi:orotate phosphoribosyltransferase
MLNRNEALNLLREYKAILEGHFLLTSGRHSGIYVEKFRLLEHPELTAQFAEPIAEHFREPDPDLVVGPLTGGILVAHEVGKLLGKPIAFPERSREGMEWRRGFRINEGQKVLIIEDVITTGKTIVEIEDAVTRSGAEVLGIGCMVCRGRIDLSPQPFAVVSMNLASYPADRCPLCKKHIPLEKRGSRPERPEKDEGGRMKAEERPRQEKSPPREGEAPPHEEESPPPEE